MNEIVKPKVSVIMPAFNEEEVITRCIREVVQTFDGNAFDYEIIVVDDGSTDNTFDLVKEFAKDVQGKIKVIGHSSNMGKGHSIITGIALAANDVICIEDSDLEYSPIEIPRLVEPILRRKADVVYGSRFLRHIDRMSLSHYLGNKILTFVTNILYGCKLTDVMTGHKVFKKDVLNKIKINSGSFEFEVEVTAKILENGFKIIELPTSYTRRKLGKAKIKWIDGMKCLIWLVCHKFASKTRQIEKIF